MRRMTTTITTLLGCLGLTALLLAQTRIGPQATLFLSDLPRLASSNGWGPMELDMSNADLGIADGKILTLNGTTFPKGLGMHAPAKSVWNLGGACSLFQAIVGIDDEIADTAPGSVTFQVWVDATLVAETAVLTTKSPLVALTVALTGAQELTLAVTDGGDGNNSDHADWANARLTCGRAAPIIANVLTTPPPVVVPPVPTATRIPLGASWQAIVTAAPEGTAFIVAAGTHRQQSVIPKKGDTFTGEPGAIMSGAKILSGPVALATGTPPAWYYAGQAQGTGPTALDGGVCESVGSVVAPCQDPEDVYIDNVLQTAVRSRAEGGPGKSWFDYDTDRIYVFSNPSGHTVETLVTATAFASVQNVTIQSLTIEKYTGTAVSLDIGAILQDADIRFNHVAGVWNNAGSITRRTHIHHNGDEGLGGSGAAILIEGNEIDHNNTARYNMFWGAGGSKWVYTDGLIVRGNYSHDNHGPGLWTDIDNIRTLYENNRVENNARGGIFHEISYQALIRGNTLKRNGNTLFGSYPSEGGIAIVNSPDVEIAGNTLEDNWFGIGGLEDGRRYATGDGPIAGAWMLANLNVHGNTLTVTPSMPAGCCFSGAASFNGDQVFTAQNNHWEDNTYVQPSLTLPSFVWMGQGLSAAAWQAFGHDSPGGVFRTQ